MLSKWRRLVRNRWFGRRESADLTGPATLYQNRSGALSPQAVTPVQVRRNSGHSWANEPTREYQRAPLLTRGQAYRAGGWRA
ncbi:hypothetical protein GA0070621_3624 [Micromonospora narathiwatensis]|uniref:Uncharacterized protein n=1 Tax=Micromonospora narathiwatensis TaxID=299146 RepID=A0A1A9A1J0_9ACTN|nr:hypothetical protein GA0070621_3624 [Micromonospora narathiwatensis]